MLKFLWLDFFREENFEFLFEIAIEFLGMQGMGGGMQGGMMMQNRMRGPGGMMQQQPGQQGIH